MLYAQLIAVSLADAAVLVRPGIPDMRGEVGDVVGFLLPYPQYLIHGALEVYLSYSLNGELPAKVVAVDDAEALYGMSGHAVRPMRTYVVILIRKALGEYFFAVLYKYLIGVTHDNSLLCLFLKGIISRKRAGCKRKLKEEGKKLQSG